MTVVQTQTQIPDRDELTRLIPNNNFRLVKFFENMAKDVSTTLPAAIGESIQGPSGGVGDRDVVIFDGPSGFAVKDSGIAIDGLAPIDSPHFTGIPTAPTPPALDSTTRIATTAFVGNSTVNVVQGPGVAVDSNIALFNGATGKIIKDSGVLIASLAPLASPAFTGNPTAPTPTLGDSDTSIATTAFVQAALANLAAGSASFSAHNNGVAQSIPNSVFTKLTFSTEAYDIGSKFASSTWTPPAGRTVIINGSVSFNPVGATQMTLAVYKNGAEYKRGVQFVFGGATSQLAVVTCQDIPNGTDTYELWAFQSTGAAANTNGGSTSTYFQGTTVQA